MAMLYRALDDRDKLIVPEWFLDVMECAFVHRLNRGLKGRLGSHENHRNVRILCARRGEQIHTSNRGHANVADDHIRAKGRNLIESLFPAECNVCGESLVLQENSKSINDRRLVIDYQNGRTIFRTYIHERSGSRNFGSTSVKRVSSPRALTVTKPPCASAAR